MNYPVVIIDGVEEPQDPGTTLADYEVLPDQFQWMSNNSEDVLFVTVIRHPMKIVAKHLIALLPMSSLHFAHSSTTT